MTAALFGYPFGQTLSDPLSRYSLFEILIEMVRDVYNKTDRVMKTDDTMGCAVDNTDAGRQDNFGFRHTREAIRCTYKKAR